MNMTRLPTPSAVVPHQGRALLLDALLQADEERLAAAVEVRAGSDFSAPDGSLPGWAGAEIMAEAIAAFAGCRSLRLTGRTAEIGLLLGIRDYRSSVASFLPGERLVVEAVRSSEDATGTGVFDCRILCADRVVASGRLTVFQPPDDSFLAAERSRDD
jgi:predicted hotdog family 3-hydroxylacyl-ACP dehydratase